MNYTVKYTGEVLEFPSGSLAEIVESYRHASEYMKAHEKIKQMLANQAKAYLDSSGKSSIHNGHMFISYPVQRKNYDKTVMREVLDEDTYDQFLVPDKTALDDFIKENLERLGEVSTKLRKSMIASGNPYTVTKLEKVER